MSERALVTGGAGLIGSHLVDLLLEEGWEVRILDNLSEPTHPHGKPEWVPDEAEFIQGSICDGDLVRVALSGVRTVFHQAALGGNIPPSEHMLSNAYGTAVLAERIIWSKSVERVVAASSMAVHGEGMYTCEEHGKILPGPRWRVHRENQTAGLDLTCPECRGHMMAIPTGPGDPIMPTTSYAVSKAAAEEVLRYVCFDIGKIPVTALRYSLVYGPRQSLSNPYTGICSIFAKAMLKGEPVKLFEDGLQERDFIYVGDIANANLLAGQEDHEGSCIYNVGSGKSRRLQAFTLYLASALHVEPQIEATGKYRLGDARHIFPDISSAEENLGYSPKVELEEGLKRYAEWAKSVL